MLERAILEQTKKDEYGSIVTDFQYDVNTRSDVDFLREAIDKAVTSEETVALIADTAYARSIPSVSLFRDAAVRTVRTRRNAMQRSNQEPRWCCSH